MQRRCDGCTRRRFEKRLRAASRGESEGGVERDVALRSRRLISSFRSERRMHGRRSPFRVSRMPEARGDNDLFEDLFPFPSW